MVEFNFAERMNQIRKKQEDDRLRDLKQQRAREEAAKNLELGLRYLSQTTNVSPTVAREGDTITVTRGNSTIAVIVLGDTKYRVIKSGDLAESDTPEVEGLGKVEMMDRLIEFYTKPLDTPTG